MAYVTWDESYAVGVGEIDEQHKRLFELANELEEACANQCSFGDIMRAVEEFTEYTRIHFATEEKFMAALQYEEQEEHVEEHMVCSMCAVDFFGQAIEGDPELPRQFLAYVMDWLKVHIKGRDKGLGNFINRQGGAKA